MLEVFLVAQQVQSFCEAHGWKFCFIGGIALQRWGEPRVTQDIDVTLLTNFENEETFMERRPPVGFFCQPEAGAPKCAKNLFILM